MIEQKEKNKKKVDKNSETKISFLNKIKANIKGLSVSEHRQLIEIYRQKIELKTPVANSNRVANCNIGDYIIIIDDVVWVYDYCDEKNEHYSQASYYPEFIRLNPNLFEKQTK